MDYKSKYSEQIKYPKWQKKRLEILSIDNFTCQICGCTEKTLHVHHTIYIPGRKVWEYEDNQLITLCEDCHAKEHGEYADMVSTIILNMKYYGFTNKEIVFYIGQYAQGVDADPNNDIILFHNEFAPNEAGIFENLIRRRKEIATDRYHLNQDE